MSHTVPGLMVGGPAQLQFFFFFCFNKTTELGRNCGSTTCLQPALQTAREAASCDSQRRCFASLSRRRDSRHSCRGVTFTPKHGGGGGGCQQVQRHRTEPRPQRTQAAIVLPPDTLRLYFSVGDLSGFGSPGRPPTQQIYEPPSCRNVVETPSR